MAVHYLEIVSNDADTLTALYQRMHGLSFGSPDADLGQAHVATRADGTLVGIRKPLAAHEQPIMRTYLAVEDIQQGVKEAEDSGATIAYPPDPTGTAGHLCNRDPRRRATRTMATLASRLGRRRIFLRQSIGFASMSFSMIGAMVNVSMSTVLA